MITPEQLAKPGTEDAHQMAFFAWAALEMQAGRWPDLQWLHHIPNGDQTAQRGAKMRGMGLKRGVWDILLPVRRLSKVARQGFYSGLYIEMKKPERENEKSGGLSSDQVIFGEYVFKQGFDVRVAYGWEQAATWAMWYLSLDAP